MAVSLPGNMQTDSLQTVQVEYVFSTACC